MNYTFTSREDAVTFAGLARLDGKKAEVQQRGDVWVVVVWGGNNG